MKNDTLLMIGRIAISSVLFGVILFVVFSYAKKAGGDNYVTGEYAKYCYKEGNEHPSIKDKMYYKTLSDCGKPLNK